MCSTTIDCQHGQTVIDTREGEIKCIECGLVMSVYYEKQIERFYEDENTEWSEMCKDILDKIHISPVYAGHIMSYLNKHFKKIKLDNLIFGIYKVLNEKFDMPISLHELSNITGCQKKLVCAAQKLDENVIINVENIVDKYIPELNLDFKTASLIKETIKRYKPSGHTPSTIVAGTIYIVCKQLSKKLSIKQISNITAVSQISIQRFVKYANTQGGKVSSR